MRIPFRIIFYNFIIILGILIVLPNLLTDYQISIINKYFPFIPNNKIILGLDLRGGSSLQVEINQEEVKKEKLRSILYNVQNQLQMENIYPESLRIIDNSISIKIENEEQKNKAIEKISNLQSLLSPRNSFPIVDFFIFKKNNTINISLQENAIKYYLQNAVEQSIEIIRQRIDKIGVVEPSIQQIGENRIQVQLPGLQNPNQLRTLLGTTAKLTFHFVNYNVDFKNPPEGISILKGFTKNDLENYPIENRVSLDGSMLTDARVSYEKDTNRPIIKFELNKQGTKEFAKISKENIGRNFAIVLDGKVLTAPRIQTEIPNGQGQITGNFTVNEAVTLSSLLRAGALPVPLKIVEESIVGPELGSNSIKKGIFCGIIGFFLISIFMIFLYGFWGIIINLALALHTILTFSILSIIGATLTFPGIAGIILGIGVAVDANILLNERIREENYKKFGSRIALNRGFHLSSSTIIDANIAIIITTILLSYLGIGPIRGFAITMMIGSIICLFTNVTIVRYIMHYIIKKWKIKFFKKNPFFNFFTEKFQFSCMKFRFIAVSLSLIISIIGIILFYKIDLNYGIDFKGGIQIESKIHNSNNLDRLYDKLINLRIGDIFLQKTNDNHTFIVRMESQENEEKQQEVINSVKKSIINLYPDVVFQKIEIIGPKISNELAKKSLLAIICSTIFIVLYIWYRFEWFFALGAIITLILDFITIISFFVLFRFDFNLAAIAIIMMIIGYSINDKIVMYDRIRENIRIFSKNNLLEIMDISINQVLIRCILTSTATIISIIPMAIFGGNILRNFAIPIIFGCFVTTLSSIFIASPIVLFLTNFLKNYNKI